MAVLQRTKFVVVSLARFHDEFGLKAEALAREEGVSISQVSVGVAPASLPPLEIGQALIAVHPERLAPFTCRIHIFCRADEEQRVQELLLAHPLRQEVFDRLKAMVRVK